MPSPAMTVGGTPLYPQGGLLDPNLPVYRPMYGGGGLLNGGEDFQYLRNNFAGGLLNGAQYNPATNQITPIAPSGVYTANPDDAASVQETGDDNARGLTYRDAFAIKYGTQGQRGLRMPPDLMDALSQDDSKGRFKQLFGFEFDADAAFDPASEDYKKLDEMLSDPAYWDQSA